MKKFLIICFSIIFLICCGLAFYLCNAKSEKEIENNNKLAHIVFTADKKYKDYLQVALKSAIFNKKPDSVYDIHILCVDLSEKDMNEFKQIETENVKITSHLKTLESIKDIGAFEVTNYVSRADLFKFFLPEIFKNFDKLLYIDSDVLIVGDLLDLYNTDLDGVCLGAVLKYDTIKYNRQNYLGFYWKAEPLYEYNCGVLLYNLAQMREEQISKKLIESKNADTQRTLMTQSAFNEVLPVDKIKKLSPVYNVYSRWRNVDFKIYNFKKIYAPYLKNINSMKKLRDNAVIIHYAGYKKPWNTKSIRFGKEWWTFANMLNKDIKRIQPPEL